MAKIEMTSSFTPIEEILKSRRDSQSDFPYQEIMLYRLCMHTHGKLLDARNRFFKQRGINETLFIALVVINAQSDSSIQPSELSLTLGSSRTNITRISDELIQRGWIERQTNDNDRRSQLLLLTPAGKQFLETVLPAQNAFLHHYWSAISAGEKQQLDTIMRKLLTRLEEIECSADAIS